MAPSIPREVVKWIQGLAVTHTIKDAKFDLANGYLIAQLFQRYYPREVNLFAFENGQSIHCRSNNWEMLFRMFKKVKFPTTREEFEEICHHVDDAAVLFLCKVYEFLTGKKVVLFSSPQKPAVPGFAKQTASWKLKDIHLDRIEDNIHRTIRRIQTLERHNDELAQDRIGPDGAGVRRFIALAKAHDTADNEKARSMKKEESQVLDSQGPVREQTVNALNNFSKSGSMASAPSQTRPKSSPASGSIVAQIGFNQPAGVTKPVLDIMRPLILAEVDKKQLAEIAESDEVDPIIAFVDASVREMLPEATVLKLFKEKLIARAGLFLDSMLKSSIEFWRTWTVFLPLLAEAPARGKIFESALDFWRRVGELCRTRDEALTQKCMTSICLGPIVEIMHADATKRDALCQLIYTFLPGGGDTGGTAGLHGTMSLPRAVARLQALKAVKDLLVQKHGAKFVSSYVPCLSCFVDYDVSPTQTLTDHLLDLYLYYALLALQMPQPTVRMAGLGVLTAVAGSGSSDAVLALMPSLTGLMHDSWWEIQAGLLILVSTLLLKHRGDSPAELDLLKIAKHLFGSTPGGVSKNVLQVGISYFSRNLAAVPALNLMFVRALVQQPTAFRVRLLPRECCLQLNDGEERPTFAEKIPPSKVQYVLGGNSKFFYEHPLFISGGSSSSPGASPGGGAAASQQGGSTSSTASPLALAKAFCDVVNGSGSGPADVESEGGAPAGAMSPEAASLLHVAISPLDRLEKNHLEVLYSFIKRKLLDGEGLGQEWLQVYDNLKKYLFVALLEPEQHPHAVAVLRDGFWAGEAGQTRQLFLRASQDTFVSMYTLCMSGAGEQELVSEQELCGFLKSLSDSDSELRSGLKNLFRYFKEQKPDLFEQSMLGGMM